MKAFNIILSSFALAIIGAFLLCFIGDQLLGDDAKYIVAPMAFCLGLFSRRIVEKIYGYTLLEAIQSEK